MIQHVYETCIASMQYDIRILGSNSLSSGLLIKVDLLSDTDAEDAVVVRRDMFSFSND